MVKFIKAADAGGAAYDSSGNIEGRSNDVWAVVAMPTDGSSVYVSLHTTEAGARARLRQKAEEWGTDVNTCGEVNACEIETP